MKRFGQHAFLRPECVDKYKKLPTAVWLQVLETISTCQLRKNSINYQ